MNSPNSSELVGPRRLNSPCENSTRKGADPLARYIPRARLSGVGAMLPSTETAAGLVTGREGLHNRAFDNSEERMKRGPYRGCPPLRGIREAASSACTEQPLKMKGLVGGRANGPNSLLGGATSLAATASGYSPPEVEGSVVQHLTAEVAR